MKQANHRSYCQRNLDDFSHNAVAKHFIFARHRRYHPARVEHRRFNRCKSRMNGTSTTIGRKHHDE